MKKIAVTVVVLLACFTTTPTMSALYLAPLTPEELTASDQTWDNPIDPVSVLSSFDLVPFMVTLDGDYDISTCGLTNFDSTLHIFGAGFDPANPTPSLIAQNDDFFGCANSNPNTSILQSAILDAPLVASSQYFAVVSTPFQTDFSLEPTWQFLIGNGPGEVIFNNPQVVPIPAAAWLFASALGVFGYLGKRKAKA